jgi:hypothetical protein
VSTAIAAPQGAVSQRCYLVAAVTGNTISYVKPSLTGSNQTGVSIAPAAGQVYQVGAATGRVLFRSGWMA